MLVFMFGFAMSDAEATMRSFSCELTATKVVTDGFLIRPSHTLSSNSISLAYVDPNAIQISKYKKEMRESVFLFSCFVMAVTHVSASYFMI